MISINTNIEQLIELVSSEVNRSQGLYKKWAALNGIQYGVVQVLYVLYFNNAVTQKTISQSCEIPKQTVNSVIKDFRKKQLITMSPSNEDKRAQLITLNSTGKDYAQKILKHFFDLNQKIYELLGSESIKTIAREMHKFSDAIDSAINEKIKEQDHE